jgi:hypothetical protein
MRVLSAHRMEALLLLNLEREPQVLSHRMSTVRIRKRIHRQRRIRRFSNSRLLRTPTDRYFNPPHIPSSSPQMPPLNCPTWQVARSGQVAISAHRPTRHLPKNFAPRHWTTAHRSPQTSYRVLSPRSFLHRRHLKQLCFKLQICGKAIHRLTTTNGPGGSQRPFIIRTRGVNGDLWTFPIL